VPFAPHGRQWLPKKASDAQTLFAAGQVPGWLWESQEQAVLPETLMKSHDSGCTPSLQTLSVDLLPGARQVGPPQVTVALPQLDEQLETQELGLGQNSRGVGWPAQAAALGAAHWPW
jgi:hypothetical protein